MSNATNAFYIKIYTKSTLYDIFKIERLVAWTFRLEIHVF